MVFFLDLIQDSFHRPSAGKTQHPSQSYQHFEAVNEMLPGETRRYSLECFYMVRVVFSEACMGHTMLKNKEEWMESGWIQIVGSSGGPSSLSGSACQ